MRKKKNKKVFSPCGIRVLVIAEYIFMFIFIAAICYLVKIQISAHVSPNHGIIVIDAGHGGIDGGANRDGILEKEINLRLAFKLKTILERQGYKIVLTRDKDISLDDLNQSSSSRHERDLIERVGIINTSNAQLFLSIHVNSHNNPAESGSIVFYNDKFVESKALAFYIQNELNKITLDGMSRKQHRPTTGNYYILNNSNVHGVIIETAFITNINEKALLTTEDFLDKLAAAIAVGIDQYRRAE